jgi:hypothetical protein
MNETDNNGHGECNSKVNVGKLRERDNKIHGWNKEK